MNSAVELVRSKTTYILVVAAAFFVYQLYLLVNSFPAVYRIYLRVFSSTPMNDPFWSLVWFSAEFVGEIGLIARFAGACFLVAFLVTLFVKKKVMVQVLRRAVFLEGAYYLFILPFIAFLFTRPYSSTAAQTVGLLAGLSYSLQILLISSSFFVIYTKLCKPNLNTPKVTKWGAIGIVGFALALWIKHFLLNLYALPINLADGVLIAGFLNSALTMLIAASLLLISLLPVIREKGLCFNPKIAGVGLILVGVYFFVYIMVALLNQRYMSFLGLTEIWAISMPIAGLGLTRKE